MIVKHRDELEGSNRIKHTVELFGTAYEVYEHATLLCTKEYTEESREVDYSSGTKMMYLCMSRLVEHVVCSVNSFAQEKPD